MRVIIVRTYSEIGQNPYNDDILRKNYKPMRDNRNLPAKELNFEKNLSYSEKSELKILIWDNKHNCIPKFKIERLKELLRREKC